MSTLHEDVIGVARYTASLLGHNAGVRHGALDLGQHMQRDGLARHGVVRNRGYPLPMKPCSKHVRKVSSCTALPHAYKKTSTAIQGQLTLELGDHTQH